MTTATTSARVAWRETVLSFVLPVLSAVLIVAAWQGATAIARVPAVILPSPGQVLRQFVANFPELVQQASSTASDTVVAFLIAILLGVAIAAAVTLSQAVREAIMPVLIFFQLIPKVALAPLFVVWLGVDSPSRLAIGVFTSFFPIALSAATGLANADANAVRLCQSLGASTLQIFLRVRIPFALPHLFAGVKVAATLVVIGVVIGEFISSSSGLGYFILNAGARSETARVFAGLIALSLFGLAFYGLIALAEYLARRAWQ